MILHSYSCPYPEGCTCGASDEIVMREKLDNRTRLLMQHRAEVKRLRSVLEYAQRRISDGCTSDAMKAIGDALSPQD
jgi:hypothetical protein